MSGRQLTRFGSRDRGQARPGQERSHFLNLPVCRVDHQLVQVHGHSDAVIKVHISHHLESRLRQTDCLTDMEMLKSEFINTGNLERERGRDSLNDLKELAKLMKEHPVVLAATLSGLAAGAVLGAIAFYQGWLG